MAFASPTWISVNIASSLEDCRNHPCEFISKGTLDLGKRHPANGPDSASPPDMSSSQRSPSGDSTIHTAIPRVVPVEGHSKSVSWTTSCSWYPTASVTASVSPGRQLHHHSVFSSGGADVLRTWWLLVTTGSGTRRQIWCQYGTTRSTKLVIATGLFDKNHRGGRLDRSQRGLGSPRLHSIRATVTGRDSEHRVSNLKSQQ